jgi:hypothetical protein
MANYFIGGAYDKAKKSTKSAIYNTRTYILSETGNAATPYDKSFTWAEATRGGGIFVQIAKVLIYPIILTGKIFHIDMYHSAAFNYIKFQRDSGIMSSDEPINIYGHSWGGAAAMRLYNELEQAGIHVAQVNTFDPVSRISRAGKPSGSKAIWNNYYPNKRTSAFPDTIAKVGGNWGKSKGADNNYSVTDWINRDRGGSGHMGVLCLTAKEAE